MQSRVTKAPYHGDNLLQRDAELDLDEGVFLRHGPGEFCVLSVVENVMD